jgi:hypothetical protein
MSLVLKVVAICGKRNGVAVMPDLWRSADEFPNPRCLPPDTDASGMISG